MCIAEFGDVQTLLKRRHEGVLGLKRLILFLLLNLGHEIEIQIISLPSDPHSLIDGQIYDGV